MARYRVEESKVLEATDGRLAKVRLYPGHESSSMVAELEVTDEEVDYQCRVKVHMWQERNSIMKVAFCFADRYVPKVNGEIVELEDKQLDCNFVHSSNQFQWDQTNAGKYSALKTVDKPIKYLCIKDGKFSLSSEAQVAFKLEPWSV